LFGEAVGAANFGSGSPRAASRPVRSIGSVPSSSQKRKRHADYLASKLTATRITRSARRELSLMQRRQRKLRLLGTEGAKALEAEIEGDIAKITDIQTRAKDAIAEAQTGIERVEATFARGGTLNDSDITLKKLSARTADLPHALEKVRLTEEIRKELEKEDEGE